ncbi:hypothetical protein D3C71_1294790 [compost metagenome]
MALGDNAAVDADQATCIVGVRRGHHSRTVDVVELTAVVVQPHQPADIALGAVGNDRRCTARILDDAAVVGASQPSHSAPVVKQQVSADRAGRMAVEDGGQGGQACLVDADQSAQGVGCRTTIDLPRERRITDGAAVVGADQAARDVETIIVAIDGGGGDAHVVDQAGVAASQGTHGQGHGAGVG